MTETEANSWNKVAEGWKLHIRDRPEADLYRKHILHPMIFDLLGEVGQKRILDAGCGEGYLSRILAGQGAQVTGLDISERMLELAKKEEESKPLGIVFEKRSLEDLAPYREAFDKVIANLVINIISNFEKAFEQISQALKPGGILVMSIPHPSFDGVGAGWVVGDDKGKARWSVNRYIDYVDGYASHGAPTYHRPLSAYVNAALKAGLVLTGMLEPVTPDEYSEMFPPFNRQFDRIPTLVGLRFGKASG